MLFYARTISGVIEVLEYGEKQESVNSCLIILILQVDWPELHDNIIEPLDIPGVELEENEVRHKTVDLLLYARTIYQWCKECYRKIPPFWLA